MISRENIEKLRTFVCLTLAAVTFMATSKAPNVTDNSSYLVESDCGNAAQKRGTLKFEPNTAFSPWDRETTESQGPESDPNAPEQSESDQNDSKQNETPDNPNQMGTFAGAQEFGFPSEEVLTNYNNDFYLEGDARVCRAYSLSDRNETLIFICREPGNDAIQCTIVLEKQ